MSSSVEQIKERLSIADVVGSYVKLEKSGSNYKARCPFHNEKTPSFFVSPARSSYYCFGCNAKGDIFSFVEQFEGLDFVGALKVLAQKAGVELVRENPQTKSEKDRLYAVLETATDFYERRLSLDKEAKDYLSKRGVKDETVKNWRLGFAPNDWRTLYDELLKKGFTVGEMLSAGLVRKSEKPARPNDFGRSGGAGAGFYDFFRGRVMFPIFDSSDRVIGFSGRIMPALDDGKTGKYVNSPETILFNKSRVLYGLNKAKFDIRKRDYSIMVEGQMDLIMSHQAGFTNTVAVSGTALSDDTKAGEAVTNLGLLTRLSNNIILAFDSDEAGFKASGRNAKIALTIGMDVKVAKMPEGDDPADIILRNIEDWKKIVKDSKHVIDFSLETLLEKNLDPRKLGREIQTIVLPYVASLRSSIDQGHFLSKISKSAGIKEEALWEEMKKVGTAGVSVAETPGKPVSSRNVSSRKTAIESKIAGIILWQKSKIKPDVDVGKLESEFASIVDSKRFEELFADVGKSDLIFQAELSYEHANNMSHEIAELVLNLEEELIDERLAETMQKLYGAERNKEVKEKDALGALIQQLSTKKQALKTKRQNLAQT